MKTSLHTTILTTFILLFFLSCSMELHMQSSCQQEMVKLLQTKKNEYFVPRNSFNPEAKLPYMDSLLNLEHSAPSQIVFCKFLKANILLELGREKEAIKLLEQVSHKPTQFEPLQARRSLAIAYMRLGERSNCVTNHAAESCIMPIQGLGRHQDVDGSRKAIQSFEAMLATNPKDLESRWLLNIAYMTVGEYPQGVPKAFLIPGMEGDTTYQVKPFDDIAGSLNIDVRNMAGASVVDDFDNDGYLDLMTSGWGANDPINLYRNDGSSRLNDISDKIGLRGVTGGLNMVQADYNNDGFVDVFVLRGAWRGEFGKIPNSLLRNNGDGTFTDVTTQSGLLSFHPTQTATWNDFNNDGWLDLFIGNESMTGPFGDGNFCELYLNNQNGTFTEVAAAAKCQVIAFVKGVTSGDYDNDGWKDIFISTMDQGRMLLRNKGIGASNEIEFENVTHKAGLDRENNRTFPTWFWDYDNDGWLDIFVCDYTFDESLSVYEAAEKLNIPAGAANKMLLYHNNQDGTFTNVSKEAGLVTNVFAMGSNFGDIDNDGYLDMYLGTGNPSFQSLIPNKMFRNIDGHKFGDVTASARVGHLQKGHGVSFADMDNDGDQDIHIEMGGALPGDSYQNSYFLNTGQNDNRWISLSLEGSESNRSAIGSRVKVTFTENGRQRSVYRDVNSGGSFGCSPLRREIGIGQATMIDEIEIKWHGSNKIQSFKDVKPNQFLKLKEGDGTLTPVALKKINWALPDRLCYPGTTIPLQN